jgi:hypothetical protein
MTLAIHFLSEVSRTTDSILRPAYKRLMVPPS